MSRPAVISQETLKALIQYDPVTGLFTWRTNKGAIKAGSEAGYLDVRGYRAIKINGKEYKAHRLAFLYMEGALPMSDTDHINLTRNDNRWINLRKASRSENLHNSFVRSSNKSCGLKGVSFHKKTKSWRARCALSGKRIHLGLFATPELASKAYQDFAKENHGEFYREPRK